MIHWRKLGLTWAPDGSHPVFATHAANPVAEHVGGDLFRVYFGARDLKNRSHVGHVEVEIAGDRVRVGAVAPEPVLSPGEPGLFDNDGASVGCLARDGDRTRLYYVGWDLGVSVPWRNFIGLATRDGDAGPFLKHSRVPILDRIESDPFNISYPCVVRDGGIWKMWYGSNLRWGAGIADMDHVIRYAESADGVAWRRDVDPVMGLLPGEIAVCRPWVLKEDGRYRMWFCHRGDTYRLGYAESPDGRAWTRFPHGGMEASAEGWDSGMVCYPSVIRHGGRHIMFYCGNRYGKTGFGIAVEE